MPYDKCLNSEYGVYISIEVILQNNKNSHPDVPERPVINYDIAIIYTLAIPLGLCLGSDLSNFLPLLPSLSF